LLVCHYGINNIEKKTEILFILPCHLMEMIIPLSYNTLFRNRVDILANVINLGPNENDQNREDRPSTI